MAKFKCHEIGHFQVTLSVSKQVFVQNHSDENEFDCMKIDV